MAEVEVQRSGRVSWITLSRPEVRNALNDRVRQLLHAEFAALADDPSISVVVIRGAGPAFSAGADLSGGFGRAGTWASRRHAAGAWARTLELLERLPQVSIAEIRSHAIGGGAVLAAACDLRIASEDVRVSIPELSVGMPLAWAGIPRLAREIGLPLARDLVLTGRTMTGAEALRSGFVQRLVSPDDLDAEVAGAIDALLAAPAAVLGMTRAVFAALGRATGGGELSWADADLVGWAVGEADTQAALAAWTAKRLRR